MQTIYIFNQKIHFVCIHFVYFKRCHRHRVQLQIATVSPDFGTKRQRKTSAVSDHVSKRGRIK